MSFDWGSVIGAVASLYGSKKQSDAAKSAGKDASAAQASSDALQRYIYDDQRALAMPGYQRGEWAGNLLAQYLGMPSGGSTGSAAYTPRTLSLDQAVTMQNGAPIANAQLYATDPAYKAAWDGVYQHHFNESGTTAFTTQTDANKIREHVQRLYGQYQTEHPQNTGVVGPQTQDRSALYAMFRNQPGYQFGLDEGNKQVQASAAARGGLNSGATLKALMQYGQNYADQKGWQPYLNSLQSMAGLAQTASSQIGNAGQNYANQVGNNAQWGAQQRANSTYNSANAWANGMNNAAAFGGQWYQNTYGGGR